VFNTGGDPVEIGLVASLNRPGGNVTGVSFLNNTLTAKQLELLHELVPHATVIGFLANPNNPILAESDTRNVRAAVASATGLSADEPRELPDRPNRHTPLPKWPDASSESSGGPSTARREFITLWSAARRQRGRSR